MTHRRAPRIANAPCSWGVIGGSGPATGFERMLDELVAAGYHGTELGDYGYMPTDPARLRAALEARGLTLLGGFVGVELRRPGIVAEARDEVLRVARLMAAAASQARAPLLILADADGRDPVRTLHAGRIAPSQALPAPDLRRFARQAEEVARVVLGETGLATAFHPHAGGWIETPDEVDALLALTDPDLVGLVFDTAHHVYGCGVPDDGGRAAAGIERFWGRIRTVHLKDCDPDVAARARAEAWDYGRAVRAGLYGELGQGSVDFAAVLRALERHGYDDWLTVEQDVFPDTGTPFESARRSRAYLTTLGAG
jgi:inosose dehydratase